MVLAVAGLAACGSGDDEGALGEADPMVQRALNDPLMVDPDLVSQNMANAALTFEIGYPLPPEDTGSAAIIAAREAALKIVGGSSGLSPLPDPQDGEPLSDAQALNTLGRIGRLPISEECRNALRLSHMWAAKLPEPLAPYPRASVKEAVGADASGCAVRVALYLTPVPIEDVLAFHYSRAEKHGYSIDFQTGGDWQVLTGSRGKARFEITARTLPSGLVEVAIATLEQS